MQRITLVSVCCLLCLRLSLPLPPPSPSSLSPQPPPLSRSLWASVCPLSSFPSLRHSVSAFPQPPCPHWLHQDRHPVKTQLAPSLHPLTAPRPPIRSGHPPCFQNQLGRRDLNTTPKTQSEAGGPEPWLPHPKPRLRAVGGGEGVHPEKLCIFN